MGKCNNESSVEEYGDWFCVRSVNLQAVGTQSVLTYKECCCLHYFLFITRYGITSFLEVEKFPINNKLTQGHFIVYCFSFIRKGKPEAELPRREPL